MLRAPNVNMAVPASVATAHGGVSAIPRPEKLMNKCSTCGEPLQTDMELAWNEHAVRKCIRLLRDRLDNPPTEPPREEMEQARKDIQQITREPCGCGTTGCTEHLPRHIVIREGFDNEEGS